MNKKWISLLALIVALTFASSPSRGEAKDVLPNFKLKLVDGTTLNSKDLAGKVTVVDFWGTWCAPCLAEIPEYNAFYSEYKPKGIYFVALAADSGSFKQVTEASKRLNMRYPVAAPSWGELDLFGNIEVYPTTLVFDRQGKLAKEFSGVMPGKYKKLRETVDTLLAAK